VQDISSDDTVDVGLENDMAWVARRTVVEVRRSPRFRERLDLATFCSGTGSRWAERRVSMRGDDGSAIDSASLWVHLDVETGRPRPLPDDFHRAFDQAAGGRRVSSRLQLPTELPADVELRPWPLRFTDFDVLGHVNNAATWAGVEESLAGHRSLRPPVRAELEHRLAVERADRVMLATKVADDATLSIWMVDEVRDGSPRVFVAARVRALPG
jgi:acyl-ACP thioesterase